MKKGNSPLVTAASFLLLSLALRPQDLGAAEHPSPAGSVPVIGQQAPLSPSAGVDKEIQAARAEITSQPAEAGGHVRLGWLLLRKGSLDEAAVAFEEALRLAPRSGEARTGKGVVLSRKGKLKEAEQALQEALTLNPKPARAHYELGLVYQRLGDHDKALVQFKEGIRSQAGK